MADFEAPSFSLGLDCDVFDSEPQITPVIQETDHSSSNQFSVAFETVKDDDNEFETLVVDDSEPEYPDSHPKLKRLRRGLTLGATTSSSLSATATVAATTEMHFTAVIDDEDIDFFSSPVDRCTDQHLHTKHHVVFTCSNFYPNKPGALSNRPANRKQHFSNDHEPVSTGCNIMVFPKLIASPLRGFQQTDSDSDSDDPCVSDKCNGADLNSNIGIYDDLPQHVKKKLNVSNTWKDLPKAYHYFFHDNPRIQELVRSRLPNFFPLGSNLNINPEQLGTSKIDYMRRFSIGESSKQAVRTIEKKKSSTSMKISRNLETDEMSQGWVNPKLSVDKLTVKRAVKRKFRSACQTSGHWLTNSDGNKVYVGKSGQKLTGRVAYIQYKKESGLGFKKVKRKSVNKKKK